jgi:hypothetical protein
MSIAVVQENPLVASRVKRSPLRMAAAACMLASGVYIPDFRNVRK